MVLIMERDFLFKFKKSYRLIKYENIDVLIINNLINRYVLLILNIKLQKLLD